MNTKKYLYNHTNQETAYVVNDYPWGFRLRTTIRYWIESKKGKGQRFCSQTINPKTGLWCKPKYSTYNDIVVMYLNEINHIYTTHINKHTNENYIKEFIQTHEGKLDEFQKNALREILAYQKVMKNVTFTVEEIKPGESEQRLKDRQESIKKINRAINYEYAKMKEVI